MEKIIIYLIVYGSSMVKFIFGPTIGTASGVPWVWTAILTACGMMTSVFLFSYFGHQIRALYLRAFGLNKRKVFTRKNRQFVRVWRKYGIQGVSFLTPLILTPILGTILANAFGGRKKDIFQYMAISAFFWAFVITYMVKFVSGFFLPIDW